ncbi:MFS general substrate transporter [Whalleya microplaca]|nr:MFS general substrate transporter [Whalleya microplaca]
MLVNPQESDRLKMSQHDTLEEGHCEGPSSHLPLSSSVNRISHPIQSYTVFTKNQKRFLTYLLGFLCLISSLSATIFFPLIPLLANQYDTSVQAINLTITLYVILQGVAPSFWSPLSDTLGRRPVFLATFGVFTVSSIGLGLSGHSYITLALLRAAQSIGGSAILSIAYGVVADVSSHAERGSMLGPMLASGNLGPCLGPVIGGGAIYATGEPHWCFWVLTALGGVAFLLIGWTFPETNRVVVGNGNVPAVGIWRTWWDILGSLKGQLKTRHLHVGSERRNDTENRHHEKVSGVTDPPPERKACGQADLHSAMHRSPVNTEEPIGRGKFKIPNPLSSLRIIFYWDTSLVLFLAASPYCVWYLIQTSIPIIYGQEPNGYGFNDLEVGLCYLAGGFGVIIGGFIGGRLMDWNYKVVVLKAGLPTERHAQEDIHKIPIEQMRSRGTILITCVSIGAILGFGWAVQRRVHPSVPLVLQCYIGAKCTILHQMYSALLVDIFPEKPSTAAASNNIIRCALSSTAVAVLEPLVGALSIAWFFTLVGLLDGVLCLLGILVLRRKGKYWRDQRAA